MPATHDGCVTIDHAGYYDSDVRCVTGDHAGL